MHHYRLETERLLLRPLTTEDAEAAFVWCSDPKVNRFMPYNLYTDAAQVRVWLEKAAEGDYDFGFVRKSDGLLIGSGGIYHHPEKGEWSFGYNFRSDCWNQGYATEATRAMIDFAHREFGAKVFTGEHAIDNPASGKVMEHCGLKFDHYSEYSTFDGTERFPARVLKLEL